MLCKRSSMRPGEVIAAGWVASGCSQLSELAKLPGEFPNPYPEKNREEENREQEMDVACFPAPNSLNLYWLSQKPHPSPIIPEQALLQSQGDFCVG